MSKSNIVTLPAGQYYIGDLCYVINDNDNVWMKFLNESYWPLQSDTICGGQIVLNGVFGFAASTAFGDGYFSDNEGIRYPVDAGMIGVIPLDDEKMIEYVVTNHMGNIVTFEEPFDCFRDEYGTFFVGDIEIVTGDDK